MSITTAAVSVAVPSSVEQVISGVRLQAEEALLGTHPAQQTPTSRHPTAWATQHDTGLLIKLTPKGIVISFLLFFFVWSSSLPAVQDSYLLVPCHFGTCACSLYTDS